MFSFLKEQYLLIVENFESEGKYKEEDKLVRDFITQRQASTGTFFLSFFLGTWDPECIDNNCA